MEWIRDNWHIPPFFTEGQVPDKTFWEASRRAELLHLLGQEVYGITPKRMPDRIVPELLEENSRDRGGKNHFKKVLLHLWFGDQYVSLEVHQWTPHGSGPFPVQLMIDPFEYALFADKDFYFKYQYFPSDLITDRGYAAVKVLTSTICMDDPQRYGDGLLRLLDGSDEGIPEESRWGAIGIWAWAASRCIDYLQTQPEMDSSKIAISGLSRAGKAALWCGAQDERIAIVMSNVSGMGGAAITRGKTGEHIADITGQFPHWFCRKFSRYADDEDALPVDSHMLLAMAAPRPMYLASASYDIWADIYAEYRSLLLSMEIYRLYEPDLTLPPEKPGDDQPFHIGRIGYHTRYGIHDLTFYDWTCYMNFCDPYFM